MTKESYYEMCEALGTEPVESEIPVELSDLPAIVQEAFGIYQLLRDIWDPMSGNYLGKDISTIFNFFELYDVEKVEQRIIIAIIKVMDTARIKLIKQDTSTTEPSN